MPNIYALSTLEDLVKASNADIFDRMNNLEAQLTMWRALLARRERQREFAEKAAQRAEAKKLRQQAKESK